MNKKALFGFLSTIIIAIICINIYVIKNNKNSLFESNDTEYELQDQEDTNDDSSYEGIQSTSDETDVELPTTDYKSSRDTHIPNDDSANYNIHGEYKPVGEMTQEEIRAEAEEMLKNALERDGIK
ncbi:MULTISPECIES: hypothetical protein [Bacillus cereus group]|uniref:hypothetical protein n=1 Tax=Bacillus cereus group TaxID=86661 RepID=UPI001AEE2C5E|nr:MULTISPECIES: hypothetical protein [Bacillus cereus group]MDH2882032.1 hypothetical protein [Bacillus cytotoxicus]MDH2889381.1 hypothetical protein [Bacillus cytotoxicus]QTR78458.1 hypothetical protein JC773_18535 [Bacillus cytotoxicus]